MPRAMHETITVNSTETPTQKPRQKSNQLCNNTLLSRYTKGPPRRGLELSHLRPRQARRNLIDLILLPLGRLRVRPRQLRRGVARKSLHSVRNILLRHTHKGLLGKLHPSRGPKVARVELQRLVKSHRVVVLASKPHGQEGLHLGADVGALEHREALLLDQQRLVVGRELREEDVEQRDLHHEDHGKQHHKRPPVEHVVGRVRNPQDNLDQGEEAVEQPPVVLGVA
mmetsp:Transcript_12743/g.31287  ORF Transcript_12743/g.31287 Transcript_12743/m.31287 type:complete len:226 (-) Transcript_12743:243-920(-)